MLRITRLRFAVSFRCLFQGFNIATRLCLSIPIYKWPVRSNMLMLSQDIEKRVSKGSPGRPGPLTTGHDGSGRIAAGVGSFIEAFEPVSVHPVGLGWGLALLRVWAWFAGRKSWMQIRAATADRTLRPRRSGIPRFPSRSRRRTLRRRPCDSLY